MSGNNLSHFVHVKRVPANYMELTLIMLQQDTFFDNLKKKDVLFWVLSSYIMRVKIMCWCQATHVIPLTSEMYVII